MGFYMVGGSFGVILRSFGVPAEPAKSAKPANQAKPGSHAYDHYSSKALVGTQYMLSGMNE